MGSQTDLDQGGTFRSTQRVYQGPSIGWVTSAVSVILPITTAGPITVQPGNSLVTVNFNGPVTINLPLAKGSAAGAGVIPGQFAVPPLTIVDIGGFAQTGTITINAAGGETIDGLASITITSAFGAYRLQPNVINGGWTLTQ